MGNFFTRQNARIEELDSSSNNAYRYPNKDGNYFANHFIMGGERFETTQPEAYLFGENLDLNFLGRKPTPFPYPAPQPNEPTKTLRSLINVRKESLRFVKSPDALKTDGSVAENVVMNTSYNIEFTFDTDVRCGITIHYFSTEEITSNGVIYTPRDVSMSSETYYYKKGVNQQFNQVSHTFDPNKYPEDMLCYKFEDEVIPVLIQCVAEEGEEPRQSHMVFAIVEKNADGSYTLKPLKQKLFIDGLCYLLQEIYGIENKNIPQAKNAIEEDMEDSGSECVICMSDARDTLILPCRHLCLCNSCADSLRYQANNCPICRAPFRALLQIRAVRKSNNPIPQISGDSQSAHDIPPGYELVSLIEALNGPAQASGPLAPGYVPGPIPPFGNSPDIRHKHRYLDRKFSSSASRVTDGCIIDKHDSIAKQPASSEASSVPEVVIAPMSSTDKILMKTESLSLTRGEGRKHRKGFRTSSAPEKMRLLTNSMEMVNELGSAKKRMEKDGDLAETRSLLESNFAEELCATSVASPKSSRPCSSSISLSTPHSLHLCEKSMKDTSPGAEDSDYFTPEDPGTTILVDQGTDTSLDVPQNMEKSKSNDSLTKIQEEPCLIDKQQNFADKTNSTAIEAETDFDSRCQKTISSPILPENPLFESSSVASSRSLGVKFENVNSLPGTPASNVSNHSSGDSFSSSSSTRVLLRPQSYETLPE